MKFSLVASVSSFLVGAHCLPTAAAGDNGPFQVTALRSSSPIHFLGMTASGNSFWLGGETTTYCPDIVKENGGCPDGTQTVLFTNALDVLVPGGQQIYVAPSGAVKFTTAHSANIPPGSAVEGFSYTFDGPIGGWTFTGLGATGFMACPTQGDAPAPYQVFASIPNAVVPSGNAAHCLGFSAAASAWTAPANQTAAAWQYI
ncbi:IgE-binding protein [Aspergillus clavatus NRRL 1]|uniref:IgE-binding protein n=1 Tax=Aspergillus clavatus (strain ATCC 1007 / CBS 513.65 / DSM 816 / NCTC 3887 / NRRL 1 / QM 1276 / 107) TaxID=344612 RepID=A1CN52_ASPCL|nr:IgE-binding protein [Aspergillus clavatus NRRL 1]EAW08989.1 IgE-binding protein [Aspergillus clavatus NRRL 1]